MKHSGEERKPESLVNCPIFQIHFFGRYSGTDPVVSSFKNIVEEQSVHRAECICENTENNCSGNSKGVHGDGECSERVKYCLPAVGGREADADSTDHTDIAVTALREQVVEAEEAESTEYISRRTIFDTFHQIIFKWKQNGHCGNPDPHHSRKTNQRGEQHRSRNTKCQANLPPCPHRAEVKFLENMADGAFVTDFPVISPEDKAGCKCSHRKSCETQEVRGSCRIIALEKQIAEDECRMVGHDHVVAAK